MSKLTNTLFSTRYGRKKESTEKREWKLNGSKVETLKKDDRKQRKKSCKEKEKIQGGGTSTVRMDVNNKLRYRTQERGTGKMVDKGGNGNNRKDNMKGKKFCDRQTGKRTTGGVNQQDFKSLK